MFPFYGQGLGSGSFEREVQFFQSNYITSLYNLNLIDSNDQPKLLLATYQVRNFAGGL